MAQESAALTRHVTRLWPDLAHLFEVGETAESLRAQPGWAAVQRLLDAEIDAINARMESTTPLKRAQYAGLHGRISGLKAAREAVDAIIAEAKRRHQEQDTHEGDAESSPER